jgi:SpoVK/Ycf46/Vps4 family AAA+-type ATPase
MASGDLLKILFRSFKQGDEATFYDTAQQIIAEEKQKNHNILAQDLQMILANGKSKPISSPKLYDFEKLPRDRERGTLLLEIRTAQKFLSDIILSDQVRKQVETLLREYAKTEILRAYGLRPKQKILFAGPPGCGKTLCAEVIASELGLPILYTRFDSIISSYLGETAANLRKVFEFASKGTWIVLFDEFDAIGKSRDDLSEHGELKRVVNTFLQLLDGFQSDSMFLASTNHEQMLDSALWRRFDDILFFDKPNKDQIFTLLRLKLRNLPHKVNYDKFIPRMIGWSHSDIERVCMEAMKISVIANENKVDDTIFAEALERQQHRAEIVEQSQVLDE